MTNVELALAYLDAVVARDYDQVEALLADDFRLRDLSPPGFTEVKDAGEALSGLRQLLDMFETVRLVESEAYEIGAVTYLRARLHFVHPEAGERMLEQHHLLTIAGSKIGSIDQLCPVSSRPDPARAQPGVLPLTTELSLSPIAF